MGRGRVWWEIEQATCSRRSRSACGRDAYKVRKEETASRGRVDVATLRLYLAPAEKREGLSVLKRPNLSSSVGVAMAQWLAVAIGTRFETPLRAPPVGGSIGPLGVCKKK